MTNDYDKDNSRFMPEDQRPASTPPPAPEVSKSEEMVNPIEETDAASEEAKIATEWPGNPDETPENIPPIIKAVAEKLRIKTEDGEDPDHEYEDPDIEVSSTGKKIFDGLSTALSWILVPILMPVYGLLFIFGLSYLYYTPTATKLTLLAIVFGLNVILPMIFILLLKFFGVIKEVGLNRRRERFIPYTFVALCMGATAWFLHSKGAPMWVSMFYAGGAAAAMVNTFINLWWKISAHSAGAAGIVALLIRIAHEGVTQGNVELWLILTLFLTGALGTARLWLRRHTLGQVLGGYTSGFLGVYLMTMIN